LEGEVQADAFLDVMPDGDALSVWASGDDETALERTVAALAATRDSVANYDFLLFDMRRVTDAGIHCRRTPGNTPDDDVNLTSHYELVELSAPRLCQLVNKILAATKPQRISEKKVLLLLADAVRSGRIQHEKLKPGVAAKLDKPRREH
jgi:hypothetical protein